MTYPDRLWAQNAIYLVNIHLTEFNPNTKLHSPPSQQLTASETSTNQDWSFFPVQALLVDAAHLPCCGCCACLAGMGMHSSWQQRQQADTNTMASAGKGLNVWQYLRLTDNDKNPGCQLYKLPLAYTGSTLAMRNDIKLVQKKINFDNSVPAMLQTTSLIAWQKP